MRATLSASTRERSLRIAVGFCLLDVLLIGYAAYSSNSLIILSDLFKESTDFILVQAIHHLRNPQPTVGTLPGILVFSIYAGIGFGTWLRNRWLLRQQASALLASQAKLWFRSSHACCLD